MIKDKIILYIVKFEMIPKNNYRKLNITLYQGDINIGGKQIVFRLNKIAGFNQIHKRETLI